MLPYIAYMDPMGKGIRFGYRFLKNGSRWWFPEIGLPLNHPFIDRDFPLFLPSILRYPHLWKPPNGSKCDVY